MRQARAGTALARAMHVSPQIAEDRIAFRPDGPYSLIRLLPATLDRNHLHIWAVRVEDPPHPYGVLRELLTQEERERADRFHFEADRQRSVLGRGLLRVLLGHFLDAAPAELVFSYGEQGKPRLGGNIEGGVEFNVSHSGEWVILGLCVGRSVGVDVEQIREMTDMESLAERYFAPAEVRALRSLDVAERREAFFTCWTRKEAYVKAVGAGFSMDLDTFEVSVRPLESASLLTIDGSAQLAAEWTLWGGTPAVGYVAAAAVARGGVKVTSHFWSATSGIEPWQAD